MTNAQIIFEQSQLLAKQGVIKYTGREFKAVDAEGNETVLKETEPIHTYNAWKELGYQVQKGQKAVASFTIWKFRSGKENEETGEKSEDKMFMKKASFFTAAQVEAIA